MGDSSKSGGGWLGAKKLWSSITTEVSQIFTEPTSTTKADESRVGQMGGRSLMAEFDQQLSKELGDSSRPPFSPTASFPSPHYGQQPSSSYPSSYSQPNGSAWNPHEASDMGLAPSLPAYQQQLMHQVPSAQPHTDPSGLQYPQPSPYPPPTQSSFYPPPQSQPQTAPVSNGHPYYPSSPAAPAPYAASTSPYPTSPYTASGPAPYPSSPYTGNTAASPTQSLPQPPLSPSQPFPSPSPYPGPAPASPSPYPSAASPYPSSASPYPTTASSSYPTNPAYASPAQSTYPAPSPYPSSSPTYPTPPPTSSLPPPNSAYIGGPSFTSAAYASNPSPSLPPPPPSNYWVARAQQAPAQPTSRSGLGLDHVDYSDLDPKSMDFNYSARNKQPG